MTLKMKANLNKIRDYWQKLSSFGQAAILVCLLALVVFSILLNPESERSSVQNTDAALVFEVRKGPLNISVVESGTIKAREQEIIKSEVEGATTILWLIEEGINVKKGDLLIELDSSKLEDQLVDNQIKVHNSEAAYVRARENLDVVKNQAESDLDKAELTLRFARQDLIKYVEGEYPKELNESESRITVAQEELNRAQEKLKWSQKLFDEKYISETELQADALATKKAELDLELAVNNLALLKEYTYKRKLAELESEVKQSEMALERAKRKAKADVVQAEAELLAKESEYQREQSKLNKIKDQIAKTKIYAPTDGLVIYATTAKGSWRGNAEPLDAGQQVKERQELIYLPRTASVLAEVKIHESGLDKVSVGLPATVTVDALPGRIFSGEVASISPLPDAASMWFNPNLKLYTTIIYLDGSITGLRTGMSCRAEILVEKYEDAIFVPLQAIRRVAGETVAYVQTGNQVEMRPVKIGLNNNRMVRVISGLEPGAYVLLNPPFRADEEDTAKTAEDKSLEKNSR
jgi:HlyD family secretion protein